MLFRSIFLVSIMVTVVCYLVTMDLPTPDKISEISEDRYVSNDVKIFAYITVLIGPVLILGLGILPYTILGKSEKKISENKTSLVILSVSCLVILACYLYIFYAVFWFNDKPDAQDGIILVMFPILASVFSAIAGSAAEFWAKSN